MRGFTFSEEISRSLQKKYKASIYGLFLRAIDQYELIQEGDKVMVAMSGGKDSLLMAKLFQEVQKYQSIPFELEFVAMDPGYEPHLLLQLQENCQKLAIPLRVEEIRIFDVLEKEAKEKPCFLCARMRRGALYSLAQKYGCNKLALGHHFDDVIETTLLNLFYAGMFKTMMPKAKSENFAGLELIRPMYLIHEEDIIRFMNYHQIQALNCGCKVTKREVDSKRKAMKELVRSMKKSHPNVDISIFKASENVNLHNVLGFYSDDAGIRRSFIEEYQDSIFAILPKKE